LHPNTLRRYADENKIKTIRTPSGQRRYDVDGYLGIEAKATLICYCRVSSDKQKDDLKRQVEFMESQYPNAEIVKDIGSGLNFKRKGLNAVLERAMQGAKLTVVVAFKDRLARFGFDLIKNIIERSGGSIVVLDRAVFSPEQELTQDLLNILHVFSGRMHGLRNYKDHIKQTFSNKGTEKDL